MLRYPITKETAQILNSLIKNPVFSAIIAQYHIDKNYIYIPKERIRDESIILEFIEKGLLIQCDKRTLKPTT